MLRLHVKLFVTISLLVTYTTQAQTNKKVEDLYANRWTIAAGLSQPLLLNAFNLAGTYYAKKISFEYSHGMFLHLEGALNKDKHVESVYVQYSTGAGIGYRLTTNLDIRVEAKLHQFETKLNAAHEVIYTNFDLGLGAYYRLYPFHKKEGWSKGVLIEPSVRYWQYVTTTMEGGETSFIDNEGVSRIHDPYNFGLFANISIGYTFGID